MSEYDSPLTMYALSMVAISLNNIISSGNRITLEREYTDIIENIDIYRINVAPDFRCLFEEIPQVISERRLDDEIKQTIARTESEQEHKSTWRQAIDKLFQSFFDNPKGWWEQPFLSSFHFVYQEYIAPQNDSNLRLTQEELRTYGKFRNKLLKILRELPNNDGFSLGRITQKVLTVFTKAIMFKKPSTRQIKLEAVENEFSDYAPYWFHRAQASLETEDNETAEKYFAQFMNAWRDIILRDPYMAEVMKYKIERLMRSGITQNNAGEIMKCLRKMMANALLDDWTNNIFAGMLYFSLGHREKAEWFVMCNIDSELEHDKSNELLKYIRNAELPNRIEPLPDEPESITVRVHETNSNVQEISSPMSDDDFVELCKSGNATKIEEAITNGANVNAVSTNDIDGEPVLILAAKKGFAEVAELLLQHGADVNIKSNHGTTALMWAARRGHEEVAEVLLKYGVDVNVKNNYASTALIWAAKYGSTKVAEILLEHGANINAKAHNGWTALRWAIRGGYAELAKLLRTHGAK